MESIFKELGISKRGTSGQLNRMVERLNEHLLKAWADGKTTVVVIDEAQNIPRDTLEHLRLLTNLETDQQKTAANHIDWATRTETIDAKR